MITNKFIQVSLAVMTISALTACSSGGDGSTADGTLGGTTGVTSSGVITGFGSVYVNGVHYETEHARIISADDDSVVLENPSNAQLQAVLGVGQVITVRGSRSDDSNGVANTIRFDDELVGKIDSVATADGSFVVLGQTVSVTPDTIIDDSIIEAARGTEIPNDVRFGDLPETLDQLLSAGLLVGVSGFPSQNGLEATRIEDVSNQVGVGGGQLDDEVKGFVSNLVPGQFNINGLTVFYDDSDLDSEDFGSQSLAEGDFVEVHGNALSATMIDATRIELEDDFVDDDFNSGEIEIEGVIKEVRPDAQGTGGVIVINGLEVRVNDVTAFSEGLRVEFKGVLQSDGSIVITRLKDESEDTIRIEDEVNSVVGNSIITRLGLPITPSDRSRLEDDTINDDDNLSISQFLSNVANGDRIEARGFPLNGDTAWTRIEIEDDNDQDCRLRGPVANITGTSADFTFEILTVVINVSNVSNNNFEGPNGQSIGRDAFFNQLSEGDVVQATSDKAGSGCVNGTLTAREVEFEPENDVFVSGGGGNGVNDNQINGTVSAVTASTVVVAGQTITVSANTLIDDSIIEAARGVEIANDQPFGSLPESLQELLPIGLNVEVGVDRSNGLVAIYIEDI